jgi:hypothetical protein
MDDIQSELNKEKGADLMADRVLLDWATVCHPIPWSVYLRATVSKDTYDPTSVVSTVTCADSICWFRNIGASMFPSIAFIARIELAKMDTAAFQERVFSSAHAAMDDNQTMMSFEHLEKRTLLFHNQKFMQDRQ